MDYLMILLKTNLIISVCYVLHQLWLKKLTFYNLNRFYFILSFIIAAVSPFLVFSWHPIPEVAGIASNISMEELAKFSQKGSQTSTIPWWSIISNIYLMGMIMMAILFCIKLLSLLSVYLKSTPGILNGHRVRFLKAAAAPFSFFHIIFLHKEAASTKDSGMILHHEAVHVKQYHSIDVLVAEVFKIINWFNPFVWLMEKALRENLEYIADNEVIQSGFDATSYQYNLLAIAQSAPPITIANSYNFSHLKNRIIMMNQSQSSSGYLTRYLLVLPLVAAFSLSAIQRSNAQVKKMYITQTTEEASPVPNEHTIYLVNGNEVKDIDNLDPENIKSMNVFKGASMIKEYPQYKDAESLIAIVTKSPVVQSGAKAKNKPAKKIILTAGTSQNEKTIYLVDGKEVKDIKNIDSKDIKSVNVFKGASMIKEYPQYKDADGLISIVTKDGAKP